MDDKLQEWIFDNLPGNISQNPVYNKELKELSLKSAFHFSFKMTQSFYNKLCDKLGTQNIPGIQIIDGRGDYLEYSGGLEWAKMSIKGYARKRNENISEFYLEHNLEMLSTVEKHTLLINNDQSGTDIHLSINDGKYQYRNIKFDSSGKILEMDLQNPVSSNLPNHFFPINDIISISELPGIIKLHFEVTKNREMNSTEIKFMNSLIHNMVLSGITDEDKLIISHYFLAALLIVTDPRLEKSLNSMEFTYFLVERDQKFFKFNTLLHKDKVEWIVTPLTKEEVKKYYESFDKNSQSEKFRETMEGETPKL